VTLPGEPDTGRAGSPSAGRREAWMARQGRGFSSISFRVAVGVAVLAASVTALVLGRRPPPVATQRIEARLELAAGAVTLKDSGTVISGLPLLDGAEFATGAGARAL